MSAEDEWLPSSQCPRDGTHVRLRIEVDGELKELLGAHAMLKIGARHPRWYRLADMAEFVGIPHSFQLVERNLL